MITVEVTLFAVLKQYSKDPQKTSFSHQVAGGTTTRQLRDLLGIPADKNIQVFINFRMQTWDYELQDRDRVAFIPSLAGG